MTVLDSSCLIGLDRISQIDLLPRVFDDLVAPPAVIREFGRSPEWLQQTPPSSTQLLQVLMYDLGDGESEAIALATELDSPRIVLDDAKARRRAREIGLRVTGTVGLLVRAKDAGHVEQVRPLLDALQKTGFHLSEDLYERALRLAGEE